MAERKTAMSKMEKNQRWNIRRPPHIHHLAEWAREVRGYKNMTEYILALVNEDIYKIREDLGIEPELEEKIREKFIKEYREKIKIAVEEELKLEAIKKHKKFDKELSPESIKAFKELMGIE